MKLRTCVSPKGTFVYGIHKPEYSVRNLRNKTKIEDLGQLESGEQCTNTANYPESDITVEEADWIFEIPNPLSFRGSTYIDKEWADASARDPKRMSLATRGDLSLSKVFSEENIPRTLLQKLPSPLLLALATNSTDPKDLVQLAEIACAFTKDENNQLTGLLYKKDTNGRTRAIIHNHPLFEAVANNPDLPISYRKAMVLRPGAQGGSEIIGEYEEGSSHIYEYLRRNSYIANGHYAANMADDAIRYSIDSLSSGDMNGLRHLYYQRTFVRLAELLHINLPRKQQQLSAEELETLRQEICRTIDKGLTPKFTATLWGWNFGFDYAPSGYRLHASHQQIHQQYALLPQTVQQFSEDPFTSDNHMQSFACGDMIAEVMHAYKKETNSDFFADYLTCIRNNVRMDGKAIDTNHQSSLIIWQDKHAMLFVPKAQTSQWELQLMALENKQQKIVGNIVEADTQTRTSLNQGIYLAQKALAKLGAKMVTSIEYSKRLATPENEGQHLLYSFLPRLPESPGAFSEAQSRYINGHYPEDFAAACRRHV